MVGIRVRVCRKQPCCIPSLCQTTAANSLHDRRPSSWPCGVKHYSDLTLFDVTCRRQAMVLSDQLILVSNETECAATSNTLMIGLLIQHDCNPHHFILCCLVHTQGILLFLTLDLISPSIYLEARRIDQSFVLPTPRSEPAMLNFCRDQWRRRCGCGANQLGQNRRIC